MCRSNGNTEITGPDAFRFTSLLTPRDLSKCRVGQGKYVLITTEEGGIVNDPVLLRLGEQHFWLAGADSDLLLYAKGLAAHSGMRVTIREPDVSPVQVQGPKSKQVVRGIVWRQGAGPCAITFSSKQIWTAFRWSLPAPAGPVRSATKSICATAAAAMSCGNASWRPAVRLISGRPGRATFGASKAAF